jgi:succinate dehydrogenase/fumarate reductase cytochrome b subunit
VGLTAVSFHLGNGLRTFLLTWGGVVGDSARRKVGVACAVFAAFVLIFSLATVRAFLQ